MTINRNSPPVGGPAGLQNLKAIDNQNVRLERYLDKAVARILEKANSALNGGRNHSLNEAAYAYGTLLSHISRDRAETDLMAVGEAIGLDEIEARATIKSGLDAGAKHPRDLSNIGQGSISNLSRCWTVKQPEQIKQPTQPDQKTRRTLEYVHKLWQQSQPATGSIAGLYLQGRGLPAPYGDNIRFLTSHKHTGSGQHLPVCLFGLSHEQGGDPVALQRVYIRREGKGKALAKPAKMSLGPIRGAAVWFGGPAETLVICEGPEDALTCHIAGYFTAAACGAFNMKNLTIPPIVRNIIIGADHGEAGEKAANKAAQTYLRQGYEVRVAFPPTGYDWNSYWLASDREVAA